MRQWFHRLLLPIACVVLIVAAGYSDMASGLTAPFEAASTGIVLLGVATVLRRSVLTPTPQRAAGSLRTFARPSPASRTE